MNYWRILIVGILLTVIAQVVHTIESMATMKYYLMEQYFPIWSKVMMPQAGPPPASFFYTSFLFGLIGAIIFIVIYTILKGSVPGSGWLQKGLVWGLLTFLLADLLGMLSMYLIVNLPVELLISWGISGLVIKLIWGPIVAASSK